MHLQKVFFTEKDAKDRKELTAGTALGYAGVSGSIASGGRAPHLHFEVSRVFDPYGTGEKNRTNGQLLDIYGPFRGMATTLSSGHTEGSYKLKPYEFAKGQSNCFSDFVKNSMPCLGIHVYHYILLNGYHVLLLLVNNTKSCKPRFKILDQLKDREWEDLSNLDTSLLTMTINNYNGACDASNRKDINSSINLCKIKSK